MKVERIDYVYAETHNWGKSVKFWRDLGFELVLDLGQSGELQPAGGGPGLFVEEVPEDRPLAFQLYLRVDEADDGFEASHWGTMLKEVTDPDGRTIVLQSQGEDGD